MNSGSEGASGMLSSKSATDGPNEGRRNDPESVPNGSEMASKHAETGPKLCEDFEKTLSFSRQVFHPQGVRILSTP